MQAAVERLRPDLVIASGDFVQRADFPSQFLAAGQFLRSLPAPVLAVPGNHELPLLNPLERLLDPYRLYKRHIHPELEPEHRGPDVHVLGVNSTKPYLIHHGFTTARQLAELAGRIRSHPAARTRIVVTHHPLVGMPEVRSNLPQARSSRALAAFAAAGVDLVLTGHFHSFRVARASERVAGLSREVYLVQSASTTSNRVERPHHGGNGLTSIALERDAFRLLYHRFDPRHGFVEHAEQVLPRHAPPVLGPAWGVPDPEPDLDGAC